MDCPFGEHLPAQLQRHSVSISSSFFFSASPPSATNDETSPPSAAAVSATNTRTGNHGFPVHPPSANTNAQIAPTRICAPNAVHTDTAEFRSPFIFPSPIFFGNFSNDHF